MTLAYSMRVSFDGEPTRWFEVENYVKFLCDHVRSVLKGSAKKHTIEAFYARSVEIIRDAILGTAEPRAGMVFDENGMRVTDVEVLDVDDRRRRHRDAARRRAARGGRGEHRGAARDARARAHRRSAR